MVILNKSSTSQTSSKKVKFASEVDYIEIYPEKLLTPKNKLFSMMDINKMKMANRKRNIALRKSQSCS